MNNLEENIVNILIKKKLTITTAESCTGGLLASTIVSVANASKVFNEAYITYANESKIKILNVKNESISEFGVVSEVVTSEMAVGAAKAANADVSIVTSGIAGPTGGTPKKPVGMVCFGIYICGNVYTYTNMFGDLGRNIVREKSKDFIFLKLYELLKKL